MSKKRVAVVFLGVVLFVHVAALDAAAMPPSSPKSFVLAAGLCLLFAMLCLSGSAFSFSFSFSSVHPMDLLVLSAAVAAVASEAALPPAGVGPLWPGILLLFALYAAARITLRHATLYGLTKGIAALCVLGCLCSLADHRLHYGLWTKSVKLSSELCEVGTFHLVGTLTNPNYLAGWILLGLPCLLSLSFRDGSFSVYWCLSSMVVLFVLAATWCRSAWFFAVLTVLGLSLQGVSPGRSRGRRLLPAVVVAASLLFVGLLAGGGWKMFSTSTARKRLLIASVAFDAVLESPLCGWGPGAFQAVLSRARARNFGQGSLPVTSLFVHNAPLQLAGALGPVGLLLLAALVYLLIRALDTPEAFLPALGCLAFLGDNLLNVTLFVPSTAAHFIVLSAVVACLDSAPGPSVSEERVPATERAWFTLSMVLASVLCLGLAVRFHEDWTICRAWHSMRSDPFSFDEASILKLVGARPQWAAFVFDAAGCLAVSGKMFKALGLYALVESQVPEYQALRTNRTRIRRVLSSKRFWRRFPLKKP